MASISSPHGKGPVDRIITNFGYNITGKAALFCLIEGDNMADLHHRLTVKAIYVRSFHDRPNQLRLRLPATEDVFSRLKKSLKI